jgi:DNA-binding transcriptional LysR family regulator
MPSIRQQLPSLGALVAFEAAARRRSFTDAAQELGVTQAAVSRQIRLLEDDLRATLFVRSHRRVEPTPAATVLAAALSQSFERIADAIEVIRQPAMTDTLTVAATVAFSHFWLLPRLSAFRAAHPGARIRVVSQDSPVDLRAGGVDVLVRYGEPPFTDGQIVATRSDRVFPVCSPGFRDALGPEFRARDLASLALIGSDGPDPTWLSWRRWFALAGLGRASDAGALRFNHYTDGVYAAINGQGVALGWNTLLEQALAEERLVPLGDVSVTPAAGYHVLTPFARSPRPAAAAFVAWIAERL